MARLLVLLVSACFAVAAQAQATWPGPQWHRSTPEEQGMDPRGLDALLAFGQAHAMDSVVVTRNGRLVLEAAYAPFSAGSLHAVNSATKAVMGTLVGIAIAQGSVPPADTSLARALPGRGANEAITLQHLLDMTSGLAWTEPLTDAVPESMLQMERTRDWTGYVLQRPLAQPPGQAFNYNSGTWQVLSELLQERTGRTAEAFAAEALFAPLGIRSWRWRKDPAGQSTGGFGLYLSTQDMARIGLLYLRHGEWNGRQVVPRAWVDKVFAARVPMGLPLPFRYADGWWTLPQRDAYLAVGLHRQLIVVMPRAGVVAAFNGREHYDFAALLNLLAAAVKSDQPLPPDPEASAALASRVAAVGSEPADAPGGDSPLAAALSGRRWAMQPNPLGLRSLVLRFGAETVLEVTRSVAQGSAETTTAQYPLGMAGRFQAGGTVAVPILSRARWIDDRTLAVEQRFVQDGETGRLQLRFDGDALQAEYAHSMGWRAAFSARAQP